MKKRIALGLLATMITATGVAMASPVEMEQGKWNVNMGVMISPDAEQEYDDGYKYDLDGDTTFYGGITYGITDRWGVQIDYSHYDASDRWGKDKLDATEFNVLYQLDPHLNAFVGYMYAGFNEDFSDWSWGAHTDGFQAGLTGWYPLGDKVKTFGKVALGNNSHVYEIGFSYAIADNWDVDLSYRDVEYKDFKDDGDIIDFSFDGVRLGVSTSF